MLLGRVIGTVVPAVLVDELSATPLLWVQPLDREGKPDGEPLVCADGTRMAGPGQMIYWVASREAALTLVETPSRPQSRRQSRRAHCLAKPLGGQGLVPRLALSMWNSIPHLLPAPARTYEHVLRLTGS